MIPARAARVRPILNPVSDWPMAVIASLLSALFASSKDLLSKRFAFRLDGTTSTFASFAYALPFYLAVMAVLALRGYKPVALVSSFLFLVFLRSVTDTFAEGMKMYALAHGDLSVVALFFSFLPPLFLLVLSPLITQDVPTLPGTIAVVLVALGSLAMVYHPSSRNWSGQRKGILLAIGGSFFFSLNSCFDRLAVQEATPDYTDLTRPVYAGFAMTLLSALFLLPLVLGRTDRLGAMRANQAGLLARGLLEVAFMVCKLYALRYLPPAEVAAILRLSLVLSVLGGWVFFRETDIIRKLLACLLILAGVVLIAWMEW